ncbi:MAG: lipid-A-disaccharide synthase N-terminal domain-containing protein [Thermodesulfobacteriota bacterium]
MKLVSELSNPWVILGLSGQVLFSLRFLVQWIVSEKKKASVIPVAFWYLSLGGSLILLAYAIYRQDLVFILGQSTGSFIYVRNLMLIYRGRRNTRRPTG